ncbi:hypothetical protein JAAARDRAFT_79859 [Jaapia argillacea MUCL 33604]|uniref:Uncharacterized protein n=1 Tax=Jaapia argillacea MUCL 33604 TaxID=933084 RepID=A0A067PYQ5_9AGAM|nr:hypothetical protein JAAARDRAFT_79859 [Jaapia argillacea MUCL 33604]
MADSLQITAIQAASTVPLYVRLGPNYRPSVQSNVWTWLWVDGSPIPDNAFTAFDTTSSATVALAVDCQIDRTTSTGLYLRALLNGIEVLSSPTVIVGSGYLRVTDLAITNPLPCPIAYWGDFVWVLADGNGEIAVTGNTTRLEMYTFRTPVGAAVALWSSFGISVNLLRAYLSIFDSSKIVWSVADARRALVESVFKGVFQYDIVYGAPRYSSSELGGTYQLEQYFADLEAGAANRINCYDMAGIVQVAFSVHPDYDRVRWNFMEPYGLINTTTLKGYPNPCNNPFWANTYYSPLSLAPQNYVQGQTLKPRSIFGNHAFIALVVDNNPLNNLTFDATSGPHVGGERLNEYLTAAIDTTTNYYDEFYHTNPGNVNDIDPRQNGVVSLQPLALASTASPAASILPGTLASVELALNRAKVENSDPPRFTRIDYTSLKNAVVQKLAINLTTENVEPSAQGSHSYWRLGSKASVVEIDLDVAETHDAALDAMRATLSCISAPLDVIFPSNAGLGQRSLSGAGGRGYILFVRDNVFVTLQGMASSKALKEIAAFVEQSLKDDEVDVGGRLDAPILRGEVHSRQVKLGETFEVSAPVEKAGWMDATTDLRMIQLINIDREQATFKFHAASEGSTEIRLVFIHEDTMQTTSIKVAVEILPGNKESPMLEPPK